MAECERRQSLLSCGVPDPADVWPGSFGQATCLPFRVAVVIVRQRQLCSFERIDSFMPAITQFFLNPAFVLPGAALVLLPILIHILSRLRYRQIRFAAMEFLLESEELNRRRLILEQLLQLLLRILIVLLIVFLISRLILAPGGLSMLRGASVHHVVILDDSLSMRERSGDERIFATALSTLEAMLAEGSRLSSAARVTILTTTSPRRPIISDRILDGAFVQEFLPRLRNLTCSQKAATPLAAINAARDILAADPGVAPRLHLLTDFRRSDWENQPEIVAAFKALDGINAEVDLVRVTQDARPNLSLSGLTADSLAVAAGVPVRLTLKVHNHGSTAVSGRRCTVYLNGFLQPAKVLLPDLEPGTEIEVSHDLSFEQVGLQQIELRLDEDALPEDNRRLLAIDVTESRRVLVLDDSGPQEDASYIAAALASDSALTGLTVDVRLSRGLTSSELNTYDCVYLLNIRELPADQVLLLAAYVRSGGGLIWIPDDQANVASFSETLRQPAQRLFPVPLAVVRDAAQEASLALQDDAEPFVGASFEPHPVFAVYNQPDSPFPETLRVQRWFTLASDWPVDDVERNDGVRTLMRLSTGDPVAFEHSLGDGKILTFLTGAGRRWSNWPMAPASPGFVVMHLLIHRYLQKPADRILTQELTEPLQLRWSPEEYTDALELQLPEAGPDEEPLAETFVRLQAALDEPTDVPNVSDDSAAAERVTAASQQYSIVVTQAERPGLYRLRRFRTEGAAEDLTVVINVPASESALALADPQTLTQGEETQHVRVLEADAAAALAGADSGREIRWILIGLLLAAMLLEQAVSLRLSHHPEPAR